MLFCIEIKIELNLQIINILYCEEIYWEGLGTGGEGDNRGWDGWMASPTQWTRVWVNSRSWWWTGRPGMLQFMGSQRIGHDWASELNCEEKVMFWVLNKISVIEKSFNLIFLTLCLEKLGVFNNYVHIFFKWNASDCFRKTRHVLTEKAMAPHSGTFAWKLPWAEEPGGLQSMGSLSRTGLSDFTFTFHFHALEKEMATHSSVLTWRIPGTGEPGGLPSTGSHRVGHNWSDLAVAVAADMFLKGANTDKSHWLSFQASLTAGNGLMHSMSENSYIDKNHSGNCQNSLH